MFYDFVRYKARILRTLSFNVLMFSVDIDLHSQIIVESAMLNSKPFLVTISNEAQIDSIVACLNAQHIILDIDEHTDIEINAVALLVKHIQTYLQEEVNFNVIGRIPDAKHVVVSIDTLASIIGKMVIPNSMSIMIDDSNNLMVDTSAIVLTVEPILTSMTINSMISCSILEADLAAIIANIDNVSYTNMLLEYIPEAGLKPISANVIGQSGLTVTFDFTYILDILVVMVNTVTLDTAIDLLASRHIDIMFTGQSQIMVAMSLVREAILQNYDNFILSSLDAETLLALKTLQIQ